MASSTKKTRQETTRHEPPQFTPKPWVANPEPIYAGGLWWMDVAPGRRVRCPAPAQPVIESAQEVEVAVVEEAAMDVAEPILVEVASAPAPENETKE